MPGYAAVALLELNANRVDRPGGTSAPASGRRDAAPAIEDLGSSARCRRSSSASRPPPIRRIWRRTTFYLFDPAAGADGAFGSGGRSCPRPAGDIGEGPE